MLADQGKVADAEAEFRQVLNARLRVLALITQHTDHSDWLKYLQRDKDQ